MVEFVVEEKNGEKGEESTCAFWSFFFSLFPSPFSSPFTTVFILRTHLNPKVFVFYLEIWWFFLLTKNTHFSLSSSLPLSLFLNFHDCFPSAHYYPIVSSFPKRFGVFFCLQTLLPFSLPLPLSLCLSVCVSYLSFSVP